MGNIVRETSRNMLHIFEWGLISSKLKRTGACSGVYVGLAILYIDRLVQERRNSIAFLH